MQEIKEPTPEECSAMSKVFNSEEEIGYAIWYPQMGGYSGRAIAIFSKKELAFNKENEGNCCFDIYIWHDGKFPFADDGKQPVLLHHCDALQFVDFGNYIMKLLSLQ